MSSDKLNRVLLKAKYSLYSALVFFLFANPETSMVLQQLLGNTVPIMTSGGVTIYGLLINTALFFLTMLTLMLLPAE